MNSTTAINIVGNIYMCYVQGSDYYARVDSVMCRISMVAGYIMLCIGPPSMIAGLVGNAIVIAFIPKAAGLSSKVTRFFVAIAACDILMLIFSYGFNGLVYLMHYAIPSIPSQVPTPGNWLPLQALVMLFTQSSIACTYFLRAILTAQRAFVVTFPLSANRITDKLVTIMVVIVIICSVLISSVPEIIYLWAISLRDQSDYQIAYYDALHLVYNSQSIELILVQFVPVVITGVSVCVLFTSLQRHLNQRRHVITNSAVNHQSVFSTAEMKNTMAIMLVGLVELMVGGFYSVASTIDGFSTGTLATLCLALAEVGDAIRILAFCDNLCVYLYCYKSFRDAIKSGFKTQFCKSANRR
jgi:hypothetical protein